MPVQWPLRLQSAKSMSPLTPERSASRMLGKQPPHGSLQLAITIRCTGDQYGLLLGTFSTMAFI